MNRVEVLLTDIVMPGMNGDELARRLVGQYSHLKVLFMSGYAEEAIKKQGNLTANSVFLEKPFTREQLLAALAEVVSR